MTIFKPNPPETPNEKELPYHNIYEEACGSLEGKSSPFKPVIDFVKRAVRESSKEKVDMLAIGCEYGTWEGRVKESLKSRKLIEKIRGSLKKILGEKERKKLRIVGLDFEVKPLSVAKKKGIIPEVVGGNATSLPFENDSFDIITATLLLQFIPEEERQSVIQEVNRVLKKGGKYQFLIPGSSHLKEIKKYLEEAMKRAGLSESTAGLSIPLEKVKDYFPKAEIEERRTEIKPTQEQYEALVRAQIYNLVDDTKEQEEVFRKHKELVPKPPEKLTIDWLMVEGKND